MIICIKWVKMKGIAIVNCSDWQIIVRRWYGIVSIGLWTFKDNSSVPVESNRFSKWQAHAYLRKVWVPPPTLPPWFSVHRYTSFLSKRWNPGIPPQQFCFKTKCSFFFKTKFTVSGAYIWHGWCKTHSDWHAWSFFQKFVLVTFGMWTED